jgi:hypothetical protein
MTQPVPQPSIAVEQGSEQWRSLWRVNGFHNWGDAHAWLWDRYGAQASRFRGGFVLHFKTQEQLTEFVLTWGF